MPHDIGLTPQQAAILRTLAHSTEHAAWNRQTVTIGGGFFDATELGDITQALRAAIALRIATGRIEMALHALESSIPYLCDAKRSKTLPDSDGLARCILDTRAAIVALKGNVS